MFRNANGALGISKEVCDCLHHVPKRASGQSDTDQPPPPENEGSISNIIPWVPEAGLMPADKQLLSVFVPSTVHMNQFRSPLCPHDR